MSYPGNQPINVMANKTLEKVEEEYKDQRITGNQDNGTGHGQKGNGRSSTSHKSSSKGNHSAGGSTGGSKGGHSN
ncbi:hypothetical protein GCM10028773_18020 [Spirosoma koreense]